MIIAFLCVQGSIFIFSQETNKEYDDFYFINENSLSDSQVYPYEYYKILGEAQSLLFENKYYEALSKYEEVQDKFGKTLSITIALGELFFRLGDQKSARNFFLTAEQDAEFMENTAWSTVYYRLGILSYNEGDEKKFVEYLEKIIAEDLNKDEAISSIAVLQGVDEMLQLFNLEPNYAYEAYRELGLYYMTHNNIKKGAFYSFTALAMLVHWGISDIIRNSKPNFQFTDLQYFAETIRDINNGRSFLSEMHIDRILYALRLYFNSQDYLRTRTTSSRSIISQKELIQKIITFVSPNSLLTYTNSFTYYPIIRL